MFAGKARYTQRGEKDLRLDEARSDYTLSNSGLSKNGKISGKVLSNHLAQRTAVYAIGRQYLPPIKIGFSRNPRTRLVDMQIGSPEELRFHMVCWLPTKDVATRLEARCHSFLKGHGCHVHGEWFDLDPKSAGLAIDTVVAELRCTMVPHWKLIEIFRLSKDPLEGCFWPVE